MAIEKLKQSGVVTETDSNYTTGLGFVRAINNNADELGTTKKLDLRTKNTPKHIAQALKEQAKNKISYRTPGGPDYSNISDDTLPGLAQIYNEELSKPIADSDISVRKKV